MQKRQRTYPNTWNNSNYEAELPESKQEGQQHYQQYEYAGSQSVIQELPNEESDLSHMRGPGEQQAPLTAHSQSQSDFSQESSVVTSRQRQEMVQALIRPHQKDKKTEVKLQQKTITQFDAWQATLEDMVEDLDVFRTAQLKTYEDHDMFMAKIKRLLEQ